MTDSFDIVAAYAFGDLAPAEEAEVERRLFDEAALAESAALLCGVRDALREMAQAGPVVPIVTPADLADLSRTRRVLVCHAMDGRAVAHITSDLDFVAGRLPVDLGDVRRLDVEISDRTGHTYFRVHEAPFDAASGEVVVLCQRHVAVAAGLIGVRLVDQDGRERGRFTLDSTVG